MTEIETPHEHSPEEKATQYFAEYEGALTGDDILDLMNWTHQFIASYESSLGNVLSDQATETATVMDALRRAAEDRFSGRSTELVPPVYRQFDSERAPLVVVGSLAISRMAHESVMSVANNYLKDKLESRLNGTFVVARRLDAEAHDVFKGRLGRVSANFDEDEVVGEITGISPDFTELLVQSRARKVLTGHTTREVSIALFQKQTEEDDRKDPLRPAVDLSVL